ncbi:MAG TPA: type II toxin-antitoxin system HicA family toxin [Candidatus Kapabacteria bacterium]|nr:type II toxin-antitoxin system HicA family toxin [Candidatus Kapabacteria bacterium]
MPRITPISFQKLIKVFLEIGWEYKKKKASHHILTCPNCKKPVVIPEYNEIDVDIIKNNLRTVGLSKEEYLEILKRV